MIDNEPVAWLIQAKTWHEFTFSKPAEDSEDVVSIPLYTQETIEEIKALWYSKGHSDGQKINTLKQLTNDQILGLWDWDSGEVLATDILDFADFYRRALLGEEGLIK